MSGISILNSASYTRMVTSLMLPRRDRLLGEYKFGVDFATSSKNYANNALPLVEVGTPTYQTVGATIKGASAGGFNTQINPGRDATIIVVRKRIGAGQNMQIVGNYLGHGNSFGVGAGTNQMGLADNDSGTPALSQFFSNESNAAGISADRNAPITSNWFFEAGTCYWGDHHKIYGYSGGVQSVTTATSTGYGWDNNVYIGTSGGFSVWTCPVLHVGIYGTPISDADVDASYRSLKAFYARLGVTID